MDRFLCGLPDLKFTVEDTVSQGDKFVIYWTMSGTHRGEFFGIAPTNRNISFSGITINQISEGQIIESSVIWDGLGLMKQLGVNLPVQLEMMTCIS